jgi:hypothetical protein
MSTSRSLPAIFIFIGILIFALWLGVSIVTDQIETLMFVFAGGTLITCAILGRRIWLILPFAGVLNLTLTIPGKPNTLLLAQALFVGFCALLFLMRRLPFRIQFTELEFWMLLLTITIGQAYLRNPVGLNIFGGDSVGARPYAIFAITLVTTAILASLRVSAADLRWVLRLHIIGGLINFVMLAVGYYVPRIGIWYGSVNIESLSSEIQRDGAYGVERATRIAFVRDIANNLALWICAFKSPIRACFHPLWAPLILLSLAFAALSGYRSEIGAVGLTYLLGITYRGGLTHFMIAALTLVCGIALLAFVNIATPLPSNIQRSLSFLPGTWDQVHVTDAENSTQWRIDMWKEALLTDYWIKNKWVGDGLGMTRQEMDFIATFQNKQIGGEVGTGKLNLDQQLMMASNNYHSGPVSTIRAAGYIGLLILLLAQIRLAVHAHRQIQRARKTEWLPLTLLIGIPLIIGPFFFVFIAGDFGQALAAFLTGAAIIRLLENNLPLPTYIKKIGQQVPISQLAVAK